MGCFSWITNDTKRSIIIKGYGTKKYPCRTVYMWDNNGHCWEEREYEGYGVFGGKDFHILLAEMNGVVEDDYEKKRSIGIRLEFGSGNGIIYPNLTESSRWSWKNVKPQQCSEQGACDYDDFGYKYELAESEENSEEDDHREYAVKEVETEAVFQVKEKPQIVSGEHSAIETANSNIRKKYVLISYKEGDITGGFVSRNPVWIVKEKNDAECIYDTTTAILYCQGGNFAKMNPLAYQSLLDFEKRYNDKFVLYHHFLDGSNLTKGHCNNPANMETLNSIVNQIFVTSKTKAFVSSNY